VSDMPKTEWGEAAFRRLLEAAPDAMVIVDADGTIVLVNLQAQRLFDYSEPDLVGRKVEVLIPDRYRMAHLGHRQRFTGEGKARPMGSGLELFGRKRDASEFPIEISLSPLMLDSGRFVSAAIRDISDRKQTETKVRRIQEHLLSAVESIQGAFAIFDADDRLVLCNSECRLLWSLTTPGEIVGERYETLLDANLAGQAYDFGSRTAQQFRDAWLAYHREPTGALDVQGRGGRHQRVVERRTAEGGSVVLISDVTEDVLREDELRRAREIAEAASSAKSEFLASMSHELRTPLNAILGFAQLLHRDKKTPLSERQKERVDHVLKGGEHLLRLIDEVLDLSRIEAGRVALSTEQVHVGAVLSEVHSTLQPMAARAQLEVEVVSLPADLPTVLADRTRFKQILMNYGSNAIKYGRRDGKVSFRAEAGEGFVRVVVQDDGQGIPADKQDKIWSPFQRAGQEAGPIEGTGIGLVISKRLAELMAGRVGFRSAEGTGSEFWVELPIYRSGMTAVGSPTSGELAESSVLSGDGPLHRIVYIEDNPSNVAFMQDLLSDYRVELQVAHTAEIGIELVRSSLPDVVIMDVNLPGMSGVAATRILSEWAETQHIPVIGLSAAAMVHDASRVASAGFYRYLTKPVRVDELTAVLEELLRSGE
jgi:PAS domain S-box-containing protein